MKQNARDKEITNVLDENQTITKHALATKHSPGPWGVDDNAGTGAELDIISDSGRICMMESECPENDANARLTAASPDMLAALKAVSEDVSEDTATNRMIGISVCRFCGYHARLEQEGRFLHHETCFMNAVDAAVAKAEGRDND